MAENLLVKTASKVAQDQADVYCFRSFFDTPVSYRVHRVRPSGGSTQPWHTHAWDQVLIPLQGEFELEWRDGTQVSTMSLRPGQQYTLPAGLPHRLRSRGGVLETFDLLPGPDAETDAHAERWETESEVIP